MMSQHVRFGTVQDEVSREESVLPPAILLIRLYNLHGPAMAEVCPTGHTHATIQALMHTNVLGLLYVGQIILAYS